MKEVFPNHFGEKSVLVKGVDGGPDENPRFSNNMLMAIKTFQVFIVNVVNRFLESNNKYGFWIPKIVLHALSIRDAGSSINKNQCIEKSKQIFLAKTGKIWHSFKLWDGQLFLHSFD